MNRLLIVRLDAIGDAILWSGALEPLRAAYRDTTIGVVCRPEVAPLYASCSVVDDVLVVDPRALRESDTARDEAAARLSGWRADTLLHPIRSREAITESLIACVWAGERLALASDTANATAEAIAMFDAGYTRVIPSPASDVHELERHGDVLRGLGLTPGRLRPRVWLTDEDRASADAAMGEHGLDPRRTLTLFANGRWGYKHYPRWSEAVAAGCDGTLIEAVALMGDAKAADVNGRLADELRERSPGLRCVDLSGTLGLRASIAVIERCAACVGTDTFAGHAAVAVGTPSAVILGGGHFGRFQPYDASTSVACRPLACYGCDWQCRFERTHCVADVEPEVVAAAIRSAIETVSAHAPDRPRVFVADGPAAASLVPEDGALPRWIKERVDVTVVPAKWPSRSVIEPTVSAGNGFRQPA